MSVERGELVALMGLSGGGKTTVLRAITALEPFDAGRIDVGGVVLEAGRTPSRQTLRELRRHVGMVFQLHHLFEHLTALENVTLRVAIARAMAMEPPLLLMDEPTASLDPARRNELGQTLRSLTADGRTLLITTHDERFAREFASRVIVLEGGEVLRSRANLPSCSPRSSSLPRSPSKTTRPCLR